MENNAQNAHLSRIVSTFPAMFDKSINEVTPTFQEATEAILKAFEEGKKHIGKEVENIHSLAESWINNQDFKNITFDDAIYEAFITGTKQYGKDSH